MINKKKIILGADEAGRGAVIGPLVMAAAVIEEDRMEELKRMGVKDSKLLTPRKREELYEKLKLVLRDFMVVKLSAREIDEMREVSNLNKMEAEKFGQMIKVLAPDVAIVDAPQVSTEKFASYLKAIAKNHTEIIAENYADKNHVIVGAASVLAKVERDAEIEKIKKEVGVDFGVGYSHDEKTIKFLESLLKKHKEFPDYVRKSWATSELLMQRREQKALKDF